MVGVGSTGGRTSSGLVDIPVLLAASVAVNRSVYIPTARLDEGILWVSPFTSIGSSLLSKTS